MGGNDPWGVASLDPRGLIGLMVSEKKLFSHYKSMGVNDPWGMANLDPRGMVGRIYVGDH